MLFTGEIKQRLIRAVVVPVRTATKRASGGNKATNNTAGRRLGPKKGEGEFVKAGQIIWRQRGTSWYPGENVGIGRDHTIFAKEPGYVRYYRDPFHAKRRFIGVALGHDERLPTPHFSPRRRRFGFVPIDNAEVAEFERQFLSKKEEERLQEREKAQVQRMAKREQFLGSVIESLKTLAPEITDEDELGQLALRYADIRKYMVGGQTFKEAAEIVDGHSRADLALARKLERLSEQEYTDVLSKMNTAIEKADKTVMLADVGLQKFELVPFLDTDKLTAERAERVAKIEALTKDVEVTPRDVVDEVTALLQHASFAPRDRALLPRKYLRRPLPIKLSDETRKELTAKAAKGEGEIRKVWQQVHPHVQEYFVPKGAKLTF